MKARYPMTAARVSELRRELALSGCKGARVRLMRNGAARVVLASPDHRDGARDAFVMAGACNASADPFTRQDWGNASNGPVEWFVWSLHGSDRGVP